MKIRSSADRKERKWVERKKSMKKAGYKTCGAWLFSSYSQQFSESANVLLIANL